MPIGNILVGSVLRSPLHRVVSRSILLLTYRGQRTGKEYTLPLSYARSGPDELVVLAGRPEGKTWWTNVRGGLPVRVRLEGRERDGDARLVKGEEAIPRLGTYLEQLPRMARVLGLTPDAEGKYSGEGLAAAAGRVPVVVITLRPEGSPRR